MEQLADYVIQFNNCPADNPRHIAQQIVETIRDGCQIEVEVHFYANDESASPVPITVVVPGEAFEEYADIKDERDRLRAQIAAVLAVCDAREAELADVGLNAPYPTSTTDRIRQAIAGI